MRRRTIAACCAAAALAAAGLCLLTGLPSGSIRTLPAALLTGLADGQRCCDRWHRPAAGRAASGVALVVHGLNVKPEMMEPVIAVLNSIGIEALNVSLQGHGRNFTSCGRLASFKKASRFIWIGEVHQAYLKAMLRARRLGVPVFFVGYSLGGLLGCDLLANQPGVHFDAMLLFAPAIALRPGIVELLSPLKPFPELVIDSDAPPGQRANDGTPVAAYRALLDAVAALEAGDGTKLNVPALVFLDRQDEFVSFELLQEFIRARGLDRWKLDVVTKDSGTETAAARHMIINERGVGAGAWKRIVHGIKRHIAAHGGAGTCPNARRRGPSSAAPATERIN